MCLSFRFPPFCAEEMVLRSLKPRRNRLQLAVEAYFERFVGWTKRLTPPAVIVANRL